MRQIDAKESAIVTVGYAIITCIVLYPIPFHLSESFALQIGDQAIYLWDLWWAHKAVTDLHTNPYFTKYLFFPAGIGLTFHDFSTFNSFLSIPLQAFARPITVFNTLLVLNFVLSGGSAYLLVRYLTGSRFPAFLAGVYYSFNPYHSMNLYQLSHASIQWAPLACLFLIRMLREDRRRDIFYAALFFSLTAFSSWYQLVQLAVFTALYLAYALLLESPRISLKILLTRVAALGGLTALVLSPVLFPMVRATLTGSHSLQLIPGPQPRIDLLGFRRGGFIVLWPVFFGYVAMALCLITFRGCRERQKFFWLASFVVFLWIAMGPKLHILGRTYSGVPMIKPLLDGIPLLQGARSAHRFLQMSYLSMAVLLGYCGCHLQQNLFRDKAALMRWCFLCVCALMVLEFLPPPKPAMDVEIPGIYEEIAREKGDFTIMELPILSTRASRGDPERALSLQVGGNINGQYMFYQTIHGKRLMWGHISRLLPYSAYEVLLTTDALRFLWMEGPWESESWTHPGAGEEFRAALSRMNCRYVIVHEARPSGISIPKRKSSNLSLLDRVRIALAPFSLNDTVNQGKYVRTEWLSNDVETTLAALSEYIGEPISRTQRLVVYRLDPASP